MQGVALYFEVPFGAEEAKRKTAGAARNHCPGAAAQVEGSALVVRFPDTASDDKIFYFCSQLNDVDHPVIKCDLFGCSDYARQKIQGFFGVAS